MACMRRTGGKGRPRAATGGMVAALVALPVPVAAQQREARAGSYGVSIILPDTGNVLTATVDVRLAGDQEEADVLRLDLVGLTVDSIYAQGIDSRGPRIPVDYDGRILRVPLDHDTHLFRRVRIHYHGVPRDGLVWRNNAHGHRTVFADNWPERARYWLPTVDEPGKKAAVGFIVDAPTGWKVVANGAPLDHPDAGRGIGFWQWSEDHPIPTYTMVLGAADFSVSRHRPTRSGIPIEVWAYPEDSAYADSVPFRRATEIVEVMERLVGPFPYEKLAHVESSTRFGGMENASAIFYAEKPYVERRMGEGVVRHETAHQWFGDAVTERDWHHLWLSEGFASYFDLVIGATLDGDSVLRTGMGANAESYFRSNVVDRAIIDTAEHDLMKLLNANNYQKGSWVLHMLRGLVGDSAFFRGIRDYYGGRRDSTALSADFERVMEKASKQDLDWFFRQWLSQPGYPQLECSWSYDSGAKRVTLKLTQAQPASWGVFRLPRVAVDFPGFDGSVTRRRVSVVGRETITTLDLPGAPADVRIDPDGALLLRANVRHRSG